MVEKFAWRQSVEPAADLIILSNDFKKRFLVLWTVKKKKIVLYILIVPFMFFSISTVLQKEMWKYTCTIKREFSSHWRLMPVHISFKALVNVYLYKLD